MLPLLALSSLALYVAVSPVWWFVGLLLLSAAIDYVAALAMGRWPQHKGLALGASLVGNLGLLGYWKVLATGPLPPGISFYTFQTLGYTLDVYRGELRPRRDPWLVLAYVAYFPQLLAGPIEKGSDLFPQLERMRRPTGADLEAGLGLLISGAVQKLVVADTLGVYVDAVWAQPTAPGPLRAAATVGFAVQLFADFSGYTDLARGAARLMGVRLAENFDRPFLAASPLDFFGRWHITLGRFLRAHVYGPLRGRIGAGAALALTFVAAGLWHGVGPTFLLWGLWFGLLAALWAGLDPGRRLPRRLGQGLTLLAVGLGMALFRAPSVEAALGLFTAGWGGAVEAAQALVLLSLSGALGGLCVALGAWERRPPGPVVRGLLGGLGLLLVGLCWGADHQAFVYFQF